MLEPKEVVIKTSKGDERTYVFSKFDAISGREIVAKYPLSGLPKIGDYKVNEETMFKLMAFVSVKVGEITIPLSTKELIKNHVPDWETLGRIEIGMMEYNCSFFGNGEASNFFAGFAQKVEALITQIVMASSARSSQKEKPASTN